MVHFVLGDAGVVRVDFNAVAVAQRLGDVRLRQAVREGRVLDVALDVEAGDHDVGGALGHVVAPPAVELQLRAVPGVRAALDPHVRAARASDVESGLPGHVVVRVHAVLHRDDVAREGEVGRLLDGAKEVPVGNFSTGSSRSSSTWLASSHASPGPTRPSPQTASWRWVVPRSSSQVGAGPVASLPLVLIGPVPRRPSRHRARRLA